MEPQSTEEGPGEAAKATGEAAKATGEAAPEATEGASTEPGRAEDVVPGEVPGKAGPLGGWGGPHEGSVEGPGAQETAMREVPTGAGPEGPHAAAPEFPPRKPARIKGGPKPARAPRASVVERASSPDPAVPRKEFLRRGSGLRCDARETAGPREAPPGAMPPMEQQGFSFEKYVSKEARRPGSPARSPPRSPPARAAYPSKGTKPRVRSRARPQPQPSTGAEAGGPAQSEAQEWHGPPDGRGHSPTKRGRARKPARPQKGEAIPERGFERAPPTEMSPEEEQEEAESERLRGELLKQQELELKWLAAVSLGGWVLHGDCMVTAWCHSLCCVRAEPWWPL